MKREAEIHCPLCAGGRMQQIAGGASPGCESAEDAEIKGEEHVSLRQTRRSVPPLAPQMQPRASE
jgi:hypothetical protein